MAINGIKRGIFKRLPEVGKIKIGRKGTAQKKDGSGTYRSAERLDHFVITTLDRDEQDPNKNFLPNAEIHEKIGEKPKEIEVTLPFDDPSLILVTEFQYYHNGDKLCHGDGECAERTLSNGTIKEIECDPETCKYANLDRNRCLPSGILNVFLDADINIGGLYKHRTHSWNAISGMMQFLESTAELTNGRLRGLPLILRVLSKPHPTYGTVRFVSMFLNGAKFKDIMEYALAETRIRRELNLDVKLIEQKAKASGVLEDNDDPMDVQSEYYNEKTVEMEQTEDAQGAMAQASEPKTIDADVQPNKPTEQPPEDENNPEVDDIF